MKKGFIDQVDYFEDADYLYLVEKHTTCTLKDFVSPGDRAILTNQESQSFPKGVQIAISEEKVGQMMRQIAQTLQTLHRQNIVHGNIQLNQIAVDSKSGRNAKLLIGGFDQA